MLRWRAPVDTGLPAMSWSRRAQARRELAPKDPVYPVMSGPDHPTDFSARRGCVRGPMLAIILAALIAVAVLVAQWRFPIQTGPPVPARVAPGFGAQPTVPAPR
jgi:hypothetical protein